MTTPSLPAPLPRYAKLSLILVGLYVFITILYIGQQILVPFIYAVIISITLNPFVKFLTRRGVGRLWAIAIAVAAAMIFALGIVFLLASQVTHFQQTVPVMETKFNQLLNEFVLWFSKTFKANPASIHKWIEERRAALVENGGSMIGKTLVTITGVLIVVFVIPVYIFMMLYYEPLLIDFLRRLFQKIHQQQLDEVLMQTKSIIQSYLNGLLIEAVIVAALNSVALLIIGVNYAILLGIAGALLNTIPFIGGILSVALPVFVALLSKPPSYVVPIVLTYMLIQFVDNHYITPKIVASKVKINALIAIFAVLAFNSLWGVPGMFLALPLTGILKVIFEHIDDLKPWAFLLGDTMPRSVRQIVRLPKVKRKSTVEEKPIT